MSDVDDFVTRQQCDMTALHPNHYWHIRGKCVIGTTPLELLRFCYGGGDQNLNKPDHSLTITSPDGIGHNTSVLLDGHPLWCNSIVIRADGNSVVTAVIEIDAVSLEFSGVADVIWKMIKKDSEAKK